MKSEVNTPCRFRQSVKTGVAPSGYTRIALDPNAVGALPARPLEKREAVRTRKGLVRKNKR